MTWSAQRTGRSLYRWLAVRDDGFGPVAFRKEQECRAFVDRQNDSAPEHLPGKFALSYHVAFKTWHATHFDSLASWTFRSERERTNWLVAHRDAVYLADCDECGQSVHDLDFDPDYEDGENEKRQAAMLPTCPDCVERIADESAEYDRR